MYMSMYVHVYSCKIIPGYMYCLNNSCMYYYSTVYMYTVPVTVILCRTPNSGQFGCCIYIMHANVHVHVLSIVFSKFILRKVAIIILWFTNLTRFNRKMIIFRFLSSMFGMAAKR